MGSRTRSSNFAEKPMAIDSGCAGFLLLIQPMLSFDKTCFGYEVVLIVLRLWII